MNKKLKEIIVEKVKKNKSYGLGIYNRLYSDYFDQEVYGCFFLEVEESKDFYFQILAREGKFSMNDNKFELFYNFKTMEELFVFLDAFLDSFKNFNQLYDYILYKFDFIKKRDACTSAFATLKSLNTIKEDCDAFKTFKERYMQFQKIAEKI
ncbi:MAG: hypothetical protein ACTSRI_09855 [Promethearchaeota archaeon]